MPHSAPSLREFIAKVNARVVTPAQAGEFSPLQRELLAQTISRFQTHAPPASHQQPLALLHLVAKAWNANFSEQAVHIGAFAVFYLSSIDLFDDVQDNDLVGKPHAEVDSAIAINNAIALMFIAFDELRQAAALAPSAELGVRYLAAFNRASLVAVGAQHGDLMAQNAAETPEQVLALHQGKTSSVALLLELGALLGGCNDRIVAHYQRAGECLACLVQVIDDLRDIYAKTESPDLANNKMTYPLACFRRDATSAQKEEFERLKVSLPGSLPAIGQLFYEAGTVETCASTLEDLRTEFHCEIAATGNASGAHRLLLTVVDSLVASIYTPEPLAETRDLFQPHGGFHDLVRDAHDAFAARMTAFGPPPTPRLSPWHLSHFNYDPSDNVIYYPDVDGLPEEVLPFYSELLGGLDAEAAAEFLRQQLPLIVAHEMFHAWRHERTRLTQDHWHEEHAANRLAVAYGLAFTQQTVRATALQGADVLKRIDISSNLTAQGILNRCSAPIAQGSGYEVDPQIASAIHFTMIEQILKTQPKLNVEVAELLGYGTESAAAAE